MARKFNFRELIEIYNYDAYCNWVVDLGEKGKSFYPQVEVIEIMIVITKILSILMFSLKSGAHKITLFVVMLGVFVYLFPWQIWLCASELIKLECFTAKMLKRCCHFQWHSNWDSFKRKLTFVPLKHSLFIEAEFTMVAFLVSFFFFFLPWQYLHPLGHFCNCVQFQIANGAFGLWQTRGLLGVGFKSFCKIVLSCNSITRKVFKRQLNG